MQFSHFHFEPEADRLGEGPLSEVYKAVEQGVLACWTRNGVQPAELMRWVWDLLSASTSASAATSAAAAPGPKKPAPAPDKKPWSFFDSREFPCRCPASLTATSAGSTSG